MLLSYPFIYLFKHIYQYLTYNQTSLKLHLKLHKFQIVHVFTIDGILNV